MSKSAKGALFVFVGLGIVVGGVYLVVLKLDEVVLGPSVNSRIIEFEELDEKVYIRAKAWGISGNHSEILLSTSPINNAHREYLKDEQYTFIGNSELFYQKKGIDSLLLYVSYKSEVPKNLATQINIQQIELKSAQEIAEYARNYKEYGLLKISVYQD